MSQILIVTPAPPQSLHGNRVTALRWKTILRSCGHTVHISEAFLDQPCELLIALHARKSAASVERFREKHPSRPIVLALTGTDLYRDIRVSKPAQRSLELATRLVLLQADGIHELNSRLHAKARVIHQSVAPVTHRLPPLKRVFEICVSGHLRPVKDPFLAAKAARLLPSDSRIRISHLGGALSGSMRRQAEKEMHRNRRYRWLSALPRWRARQLLGRSRLLVLTSKLEGGANVVSEALAAQVPVLSTRISGSVGLLGEDYSGFFPVGDEKRLAQLMYRCETDSAFYQQLRSECRRRAPLTKPSRERAAWKQLLAELL